MSILTNVSIPVTSLSPQRASSKALQEQIEERRFYSDGPLLVKPSGHAPRRARIVSRVAYYGVPLYLLQIGDVSVPDVGLDEVLDYVSPRDLEEFETCQFEEENDILKVAEAAREAEREAAREYAKERAKRKGVAAYEERDEGPSTDEADAVDAILGRRGRARPSYAHLYEIPQRRRRRRKRDAITGELLPLSDLETETATDVASSQEELPRDPSSTERPKRRRRRRDKVTGELIPLSPDTQPRSKAQPSSEQPLSSSDYIKRPRRRRHPVTKELMPLGWRYDPGAENEAVDKQNTITDASALPSTRGEGMKDGPDIKRLKLAAESVGPSSVASSLTAQPFQNTVERMQPKASAQSGTHTPNQMSPGKKDLQHQSSDDSEIDAPEGLLQRFIVNKAQAEVARSAAKTTSLADKSLSTSPSKQLTLAAFLAGNSKKTRSPSVSSVTSESIDELQLMPKTSLLRPSASAVSINNIATAQKKADVSEQEQKPTKQQKTSITNPVASEKDFEVMIDLDGEEQALNKDEWFVEAILDHHLSDPRSHPPDFGRRPVMLYQTKWQDFDELTWEPAESFIERGVLDDYRARAGLRSSNTRHSDERLMKTKQGPAPGGYAAPSRQSGTKVNSGQIPEGADGEDYEIEKILAHHLSDPRTHSRGLGKDPVMLYLVKWVGYEEPTWEPINSFPDRSIIEEYEALTKKPKFM